jgi:hypothetical protein
MKFLPMILAAVVAAVFSVSAQAASKKKSTPAPAADTSDKITAVHLTSISISVFATHSAKEYKVTPATKITVNGQPAQLNGLATGMSVVVAPAPDGVTAAAVDAKTPKR